MCVDMLTPVSANHLCILCRGPHRSPSAFHHPPLPLSPPPPPPTPSPFSPSSSLLMILSRMLSLLSFLHTVMANLTGVIGRERNVAVVVAIFLETLIHLLLLAGTVLPKEYKRLAFQFLLVLFLLLFLQPHMC